MNERNLRLLRIDVGFSQVDEELIRMGASYLRVIGISYLLTGFSQVYLCVLKIPKKKPPRIK